MAMGSYPILLSVLRLGVRIIPSGKWNDFWWNQLAYVGALLNTLAHSRAADVVERCVQQVDIEGQTLFVNGSVEARIDDDFVISQNIFMVCPLIKYQPVVGSDDECE